MHHASSLHFYSNLAPIDAFTQGVEVSKEARAPEDWHVVIVEVVNSHEAIEQGRYKDVNALCAAAIVAVHNAMRKAARGVEVPSVFQGDNATILVPEVALTKVRDELAKLVSRAEEGFSLSLASGSIPILALSAQGAHIALSKHALSEYTSLAMFSGGGLSLAHELFDARHPEVSVIEATEGVPDLEGFECRWKPVPSARGQIVSVLVKALDEGRARHIYALITDRVDAITKHTSHPIHTGRLQLSTSTRDFRAESLLRAESLHRASLWLRAKIILCVTLLGAFLLRHRLKAADFNGATYLDEVVRHTDYRRFDDTLRLTLDLDKRQQKELDAFLEELHERQKIVYGVHRSDSAQITCMIESHDQRHIHFVDGASGGYACAAIEMKQQLRATKPQKRRAA